MLAPIRTRLWLVSRCVASAACKVAFSLTPSTKNLELLNLETDDGVSEKNAT